MSGRTQGSGTRMATNKAIPFDLRICPSLRFPNISSRLPSPSPLLTDAKSAPSKSKRPSEKKREALESAKTHRSEDAASASVFPRSFLFGALKSAEGKQGTKGNAVGISGGASPRRRRLSIASHVLFFPPANAISSGAAAKERRATRPMPPPPARFASHVERGLLSSSSPPRCVRPAEDSR